MKSITQTQILENELSSSIDAFFRTFGLCSILKKVGAYKSKGIPVVSVFQTLFALVFSHKSLFMDLQTDDNAPFAKDTFYRLLNSYRINWARFTRLLATRIINTKLNHLTDDKRVDVFIVDDTPYERNRSKKVELLCRVYDHSKRIYFLGFRLLTLGWSDGNTFIPVDSCLLSSEDEENRLQEARSLDKRTCGHKQRQLAQTKAPAVMIEMLRSAVASGIHASYVLFDSWFSFPATILNVLGESLHVIAMVKKTSKVHYQYNGEMLSVTQIYSRCKKRRGCSKYLLSVEVKIRKRDKKTEKVEWIPVQLVYVRKRGNRKDYLVLISTDMSISEKEIIRIYGKRWNIEVFFKNCKSFLRLTKECRSMSYDAMSAWTAIVFARYMMLALENRMQKDDRSFGELFYHNCDELSDITCMEAFRLLMETFLDVAAEKYLLADDEVESLLEAFISALPAPLRNSLLQCA